MILFSLALSCLCMSLQESVYVSIEHSNEEVYMLSKLNVTFTNCPAIMQLKDSSVDSSVKLIYKPYMDSLCSTLTVAAPGMKSLRFDEELRVCKSDSGSQRAVIQNWLFCSDRLRRIRLTYFDAGSACQAFNSLLYPDWRFDYPLLGIDLLAFGKKKILCVVDFQPLSQDPGYLEKYTAGLAPIQNKFAMFCSKMSTRFYNEKEFFSKQLIFYRSDRGAADPLLQVPDGLFFSTYMGYVTSYLKWLHLLEPVYDLDFKMAVRNRHTEYDTYSSERDPAIKVFTQYFGQKWSERFASEFLFPRD
ncbi:hypothetical protein KP509_30G014300 [Ceratopteris richardii]|uniref:Uncharacterized protein n=1 Tax=Ceratopteris richardii TaxID=49495 RepID=A0A8T2R085_CERRI|nr:hypothetical protein KP509_30G014300 [Ceratopteris richardii]